MKFKSKFNGFVGIMPYTSTTENRFEESFLYNLKKDGIVDHLIVSVYVNSETGKSMVLFGNWDKHAMKNDEHNTPLLKFISAPSIKDWSLQGLSFEFKGTTTAISRKISIAPQYPHVYIPDTDFSKIRAKLGSSTCSTSSNYCKFEYPCSDDKIKDIYEDLDLKFTI